MEQKSGSRSGDRILNSSEAGEGDSKSEDGDGDCSVLGGLLLVGGLSSFLFASWVGRRRFSCILPLVWASVHVKTGGW